MMLIYQIGRLDSGAFNPIKFEVNGKEYTAQLSSFALRQSFLENGEASKVILIYPVSLFLNKSLSNKNNPQTQNIPIDFKKVIESILYNKAERFNYLSNPYPYFAKHPHSKEADEFIVIHSIGQYEGINFSATLEELILEIFIDMVKRYQDEPFSELYLDISSGHNIYTSALLEAGRLFLTFYKLQNFLTKGKELNVFITFSDPILPPYERTFKIHKGFLLEVKVFFSYPEKPYEYSLRQGYMKFAGELAKENREIKRDLNDLFSYGKFFYSAIKNNIPLVLYTQAYHSEERINEGLQILIKLVKDSLTQNYQNTPKLNFDLFRKAFLMLAIYKGITEVLKTYKIAKKEEVSISELREKFVEENKSLYKYFGLVQNRNYLSQEIKNNFDRNKDKFEKEYKLLREYIGGESEDFNPRNFFAHCGFERNSIYVRKDGEEILVKYREDRLEEIAKILMEY
ncbi:CRISPR-associated CARF protein Csx1 [Thermodesulfobacterium geofontis]|jgi:CRISPR-associated protein Csx1|nr:CRISPR-associated CARF protein Csx1 [Thermodesulfobacterium geofontis]